MKRQSLILLASVTAALSGCGQDPVTTTGVAPSAINSSRVVGNWTELNSNSSAVLTMNIAANSVTFSGTCTNNTNYNYGYNYSGYTNTTATPVTVPAIISGDQVTLQGSGTVSACGLSRQISSGTLVFSFTSGNMASVTLNPQAAAQNTQYQYNNGYNTGYNTGYNNGYGQQMFGTFQKQ